ncbi:MAG: glycoside hydrolase family 13 protein [Bacteroidota bacterium]
MKFSKFILSLIILSSLSCKDQNSVLDDQYQKISQAEFVNQNDINRIEPPNWWAGFKSDSLQLMVNHPNIGDYVPIVEVEGVSVEKFTKGNNSNNYLFIDLKLNENVSATIFNIHFKSEKGDSLISTYELKERNDTSDEFVGFDSSDAIYLITPDRFANAYPLNDTPSAMEGNPPLLEQTINRKDDYARHGGDIQGMTEHLDYISDMGFTAVWPQPMLTNNMPRSSYHGYAITDLYEVDPRFGTLEEYIQLSQSLKEKDMKLIMDQVANHIGLEHPWMKDLPFNDWVNNQDNYEANIDNWNNDVNINSNHRRTANMDTYASEVDKKGLNEGWFVSAMPDMNQRNPFLARYLIQNSIWWIETVGLGGIRQDTYPYPDKEFMSDWAGAIMDEYPNFSIVGEEWSYNPLLIGYWQDGADNKDGYDSNLRASMDFAMQQNVVDALMEQESWDKGLVKIYEGLANDFHYVRPKDILVFPDNHDKSRIFTQLKGDIPNTKMALATYAVMPRILQIYYGTEILMNDFEKPGDHGLIRTDFPGGWEGDTKNAFTGENLTAEEKDMQQFTKSLLNYRKESEAIHSGDTKHFAPYNGIYVLTRKKGDETIVLILNKNERPTELDLERFNELNLNGKTMRNVISNETLVWEERMKLEERGLVLLTTK